ncbi:MAG: VWA domain-containing protein [Candidatus Bathyarchaeia archaeon]
MSQATIFPFSAIVSLEDLKLALILNAVNPKIGGVLIRGSKGSGKTTAVRALADVLPNIKAVKDCSFNCNPDDASNMCEKCRADYFRDGSLQSQEKKMRVVDLPLGATEDAVVGTLDIEKAIKSGTQSFEPGILAEANQNILYIDEVNLLPDHIADDLLDAAATGWNIVEREGVSVKHPSRFILVGTMNPEEGQIRPQLLDRFALSAEAHNIAYAMDRVEIVKRNIDFEANPEAFVKKANAAQEELKARIAQARENLPNVELSERLIEVICRVCIELKVDGVRPDIVIAKTARTLAAFENKNAVTVEHVAKAAELALNHRTREGGFLEPATSQEIRNALSMKLKEANYDAGSEKGRMKEKVKGTLDREEPLPKNLKTRLLSPFGLRSRSGTEKQFGRSKNFEGETPTDQRTRKSQAQKGDLLIDFPPEKGGKHAPFVNKSELSLARLVSGVQFLDRIKDSRFLPFRFFSNRKKPSKQPVRTVGKRAESLTSIRRGRSVGWKTPKGSPLDIHFAATIRSAARKQEGREHDSDIAITIRPEDVKEKLRIYRAPMTIVFVLDLSESMLEGIDSVKEVMLRLHNDAYRYRDRVGLVAFKDTGAIVAQHPTANLRLVTNKLLKLRMSGLTPLAAGMLKGLEVLKEEKRRNSSTIPVLTIITDGEANIPLRDDMRTGLTREFNPLDASFYHYEKEARTDAISVAQMIRREGIQTVVINTAPNAPLSPELAFFDEPSTTGSWTTGMIATLTNGMHYELRLRSADKEKAVAEISGVLLQTQERFSFRHRLLRGKEN